MAMISELRIRIYYLLAVLPYNLSRFPDSSSIMIFDFRMKDAQEL